MKRRLIWGLKLLGISGLVVVIFGLGLGVGNGTVRFGSDSQNKELPSRLDYSSVDRLHTVLKDKYDGDLDTQKLLDGIKAGMAEAAGDPYTVYLNAEQAELFSRELNGTFSGIGAELGKNADGNLIIVAPIEGTPASKAGLRPQDVVVSVDDESTAGISIEEAVTKIRGPKGTAVSIRVVRDKKTDLTFKIVRDDITVPSVKSEILDGNIGYLRLSQFGEDTAKAARQAAQSFKDRQVTGVILDLRGNPGGLLNAAVSVSSLWLPENKTVLVEKRGNIAVSTQLSNGLDPLKGIPTVVLINEGSASASEIVAGALKDNGVATLMGVKTFGKGSVQERQPLAGGAELKVTVARWFRPSGENIDKKGISPDREVKMTNDDIEKGLDPQKDAAIQFLLNQ